MIPRTEPSRWLAPSQESCRPLPHNRSRDGHTTDDVSHQVEKPPPALASVFKLNTRRPTDLLLRCCHIDRRVWPSITPTILIMRQFVIWLMVNWTEFNFLNLRNLCIWHILPWAISCVCEQTVWQGRQKCVLSFSSQRLKWIKVVF